MHQDDSPPSRWILQVSWTATAGVLAFLLGPIASLAATPVGSTAKLEDATMRWAIGQPYTDPKAPEVHDPATPPELMIRYLQSHWTDQDHEVLRADGPLGWRTLQAGKPFCYGMMQQSAANKSQLLFSPTALALPLRLIVANHACLSYLSTPWARWTWPGCCVKGVGMVR